jgi:hypothetical protein
MTSVDWPPASSRYSTTRRIDPLVLFGHSLGAIVAYETARILMETAPRVPAGLVASGRGAPDIRRQLGPTDLRAIIERLALDIIRESEELAASGNPQTAFFDFFVGLVTRAAESKTVVEMLAGAGIEVTVAKSRR